MQPEPIYIEIFEMLYKFPSVNDWYASKNWAVRQREKNKFLKYIRPLLEGQAPAAAKIYKYVHVHFETSDARRDLDNNGAAVKLMLDALVAFGWLVDDSVKNVVEIIYRYNQEIPKLQKKFTIIYY